MLKRETMIADLPSHLRGVAELIVEGKRGIEIAKILSCTENRVRLLTRKVFSEIGVTGRVGVAISLSPEQETVSMEGLSSRERECMVLLRQGWRNKEIGMALGVHHTTIKTYIKHARAKLGMQGFARSAVAMRIPRE